AINTGFARATGRIMAWLNSDDLYLPGALHFAAAKLDIGEAQVLFGNSVHFLEEHAHAWGSNVKLDHERSNLRIFDYIIQPSTFWTREAWDRVGPLDAKQHYCFDWDWFIRAQQASVTFKPQDKYLSLYRFHSSHKTSSGAAPRLDELA